MFLVKYDADGHRLWTRTFGGPDHEYGRSLSVDASGRVYVGGKDRYTGSFDNPEAASRAAIELAEQLTVPTPSPAPLAVPVVSA